MNYLKNFLIQHTQLDIGSYHFDFEINEKFFECFEYSEIHSGQVHIKVDLEKTERMLILKINLFGTILTQCDRCGDDFQLPIEGKEQLIVKFGDSHKEETDEIIIIPESEPYVDLSSFFYEFIHLACPMQAVHLDDENGQSSCNAETIKLLSKHSIAEDIDPRWEILKKLQDNK